MSESGLEAQIGESIALVRRVKALEKLNAVLAAEVDRMRPVVKVAQRWRHGWERRKSSQAYQTSVVMAKVIDTYEASALMTTTDDNNCCHFQD